MGTPNMLDPPPHPLFSPLIDSSGTCFWPTQSRAGLGWGLWSSCSLLPSLSLGPFKGNLPPCRPHPGYN